MAAVPSPPANNLACFLPIRHLIHHLCHCLYLCNHFYHRSQHTHVSNLAAVTEQVACSDGAVLEVDLDVHCQPLLPSLPETISAPQPGTKHKLWPADFHAVDITNCLQEIESSGPKETTWTIFECHFCLPFKSSTFYAHQDLWKQASLNTKNALISAGCAGAGLWIHFMANNQGGSGI